MSRLRHALRIVALAAVLGGLLTQGALSARPARADDAASAQVDALRMPHYFDETGFWVQGPFREYWETHGGLYTFGLPITGVFMDNGFQKQYFERAIFEWHPENDDPYKVELQRLGAIRTDGRQGEQAFQPLPSDTGSDDNCEFYGETGHRLCFGFKTYWHANGGLPNFGYPLSEEFTERNDPPPAGDGQEHTVQYFERARFEYHPEYAGTQYETLLGLLGSEYLARNPAPASAVTRQPKDLPPADPTTGLHYGPHVGYGFNIAWHGDDHSQDFHQQTLDKVNEAGFGWIRIQVQWREIERSPGQYDFAPLERIVNLARQNNVRVLASVLKAPSWATSDGSDGIPGDAAPYQALMQQLASVFKGRVDAWEIWNEQNLATETGGTVDLGRYVNLLKAGYTGVKAGNPDAIVVFGGLTPNGVNDPSIAIDDVLYMQQIYAYNNGEVKQYYDVLGAHPGGNSNSPDQYWPDNPGTHGWSDDESFYFRRIQQLRDVMVDNGEGAKQIWLTEFGWTTANQAPGYGYGEFVTDQDQADYLVRAYEIAKNEWPYIGVMCVWNLNFSTQVTPADEKGPWSVLNADWSNRPSFDALKAMPK
jgi:hypothetical protein